MIQTILPANQVDSIQKVKMMLSRPGSSQASYKYVTGSAKTLHVRVFYTPSQKQL